MRSPILHKTIVLGAALSVAGLVAGDLIAATGDSLSITVSRANVRSGPSRNHPVIMQLSRGGKVVELQRQNGWVEITSGRTDPKSGWIHSALVGKDTTNKTGTANQDAGSDPLFALFKMAFEQMSTRIKNQTGKTYFAKVENPGNRVIQVTVAADWSSLTRTEREEQLTEIFRIWDAAVGDGVPITVDIIDQDGIRLLSKFK